MRPATAARRYVRHAKGDDGDALILPPHSREAEQSVLGSLMLDNTAAERINGSLRVDDFYSDAHRIIYDHIGQLIAGDRPIDVTTLGESLARASRLDYVGGLAYLGALVEQVPTAANISHYATIVRERARLRAIMAMANELHQAAGAPLAPESAELLLAGQAKLEALARGDCAAEPAAVDLAQMAAAPVPERRFRVGRIMPMGLPGLFTGHGGAGKTQLSLHLACCLALGRPFFGEPVTGAVVAYMSTEDDRDDLHFRLAQQVPMLGDALFLIQSTANAALLPILIALDPITKSAAEGASHA